MKTVPGRTDRVVIVGAGLAGLSAALRLAGAGREVTVLEREDVPGGRNGLLEGVAGRRRDYRFDTGPTVLTMPDLIADALDCVGERLEDWLELEPVDPLYRAYYPDGSTLDVKADPAAMADEVERVCGPEEAHGYLRFVDFVSKLYRYEMQDFIDRNIDSPLDLLTPNLARLVAIGGFGRLAPKVESYLQGPAHAAGPVVPVDVRRAEPVRRAGHLRGHRLHGLRRRRLLPEGRHARRPAGARRRGGEARRGAPLRHDRHAACSSSTAGPSASRPPTASASPADVVVLNPDLPVAYRELLPPEATPRRVKRLDYSPSCFLLLAGSTQAYTKTAHHNIHFGRSWAGVFDELIDSGS